MQIVKNTTILYEPDQPYTAPTKKTNTGISDSADAACEQLYPRMSEIPVFCYYIMIALFKDILYTLL